MKRAFILPGLAAIFIVLSASSAAGLVDYKRGVLFYSNFDKGVADGWTLCPDWSVVKEDGGYVLFGSREWAATQVKGSGIWTDYDLSLKFKIKEGAFHCGFRLMDNSNVFSRYFLSVNVQGECILFKQVGQECSRLFSWRETDISGWHLLSVSLSGKSIKIYLDSTLRASYSDDQYPLRAGRVNLEALWDNTFTSKVYFDEVKIVGLKSVQDQPWSKIGGPLGGLGYDIRIHPNDPQIMFVTDNPSGVQISRNGGTSWKSTRKGITAQCGASGDGVPCFSLAVDPNNPQILWTGMQGIKGLFKSMDGGKTWLKKDNGIEGSTEITLRGFAVKPGDSSYVLAAAEIDQGVFGTHFNKVKGRIFLTEDGGENWRCVWKGDSLARVLIFDPRDTDIIYCSTGIFDREAWNDSGVGILKSLDGGNTWRAINNGLDCLFIGFLEMDRTNPDILYAAAGSMREDYLGNYGGIYKTTNGGKKWTRVLRGTPGTILSVVAVSPSKPEVVYAGSLTAFFRSDDVGATWKKYTKPAEGYYGLPGIRPGHPISAVVHPHSPLTIFVNNYGGGAFRSDNGAKTWVDSSRGYTGADTRKVTTDRSGRVYAAVATGGLHRSDNGGVSWKGLCYSPAQFGTYHSIVSHPSKDLEILASDQHQGVILKSIDAGKTWEEVFRHPLVNQNGPGDLHGFKTLSYAPSNPSVIYAGMHHYGGGDGTVMPSYGVYRSMNGGKSWEGINVGLENTDKNITALAVHLKNWKIAFMGTRQDGLFKTTSGGESWQPISAGLGSMEVRAVSINPFNPDQILAGLGEGAGIYRSQDGGRTWRASNDGILPECPSYLQRAGESKLGVSLTARTANVSSASYAVPWSRVLAVLFDPLRKGWVFAGDEHLGVFFSEDSGRSWSLLTQGLSTRSVHDLATDGTALYAATWGEGVFKLNLPPPSDP